MPPIYSLRFAVAALVVACLTALAAYPVRADTPPTLTVEGRGEAQGKPDIATITLGVVTQGKTSAEAMEANARIAATLVNQLRERGIADRDLMTIGLSLMPDYAQDKDRASAPKIAGYRAMNRLSVRLRDLTKIGTVLDMATAAGVNDISGPMFGVADPQGLQDEARKKAVAEARRVADLYAQSLGVKLGPVREMVENAGNRPMAEPRMMLRGAPAAMAAPVAPIEGGEMTAATTVTITYEIIK
ncbi:MAG: DUF541 domain-containing protein [Beijerinckiaceae bacterium]|nr:DUF541 domain-containing protein [Beijerinckiaceae bacterium]